MAVGEEEPERNAANEEENLLEEEEEEEPTEETGESRRFPTYYLRPGPADADQRRRSNPCGSGIVEQLKSAEHVVPVRRSPEEEDNNFYIDVSHELLETGPGIVPRVVYRGKPQASSVLQNVTVNVINKAGWNKFHASVISHNDVCDQCMLSDILATNA